MKKLSTGNFFLSKNVFILFIPFNKLALKALFPKLAEFDNSNCLPFIFNFFSISSESIFWKLCLK